MVMKWCRNGQLHAASTFRPNVGQRHWPLLYGCLVVTYEKYKNQSGSLRDVSDQQEEEMIMRRCVT
jgi:hypothetical protein